MSESLSVTLEFLGLLSDFFADLFKMYVFPGLSLFTVLLYNLIFVLAVNVWIRR